VSSPDKGGKCLRFDLDRERARSYGGLYYSDYVDLRPGATYRFQVRIKSSGLTPMVFLKCSAEFPPAFGFEGQRREVYRRPIHAQATASWTTYTTDFTPRHSRYTPRWLRVMLYAYGADAGTVYFDNCILKEIKPPPPAVQGRLEGAEEGEQREAD
jgi:hypothetical protein